MAENAYKKALNSIAKRYNDRYKSKYNATGYYVYVGPHKKQVLRVKEGIFFDKKDETPSEWTDLYSETNWGYVIAVIDELLTQSEEDDDSGTYNFTAASYTTFKAFTDSDEPLSNLYHISVNHETEQHYNSILKKYEYE